MNEDSDIPLAPTETEECKAEEVKPKPKPKKVKAVGKSEIQLLKDEVAFLKKGLMIIAHMTGNEPQLRAIGAKDEDMYMNQKG